METRPVAEAWRTSRHRGQRPGSDQAPGVILRSRPGHRQERALGLLGLPRTSGLGAPQDCGAIRALDVALRVGSAHRGGAVPPLASRWSEAPNPGVRLIGRAFPTPRCARAGPPRWRRDRRGAFEHDAPVAHHVEPMRHLERDGQLLHDEEDGHPAAGDLVEELADLGHELRARPSVGSSMMTSSGSPMRGGPWSASAARPPTARRPGCAGARRGSETARTFRLSTDSPVPRDGDVARASAGAMLAHFHAAWVGPRP